MERNATTMIVPDYYRLAKSVSCQDSIKTLQADVDYANLLATSIPRFKGGTYLQMKLVYNDLAPLFLVLFQWMNFSCTCLLPSYLNLFNILLYEVSADGKQMLKSHGRKATVREFYAVILPSLLRLHGNSSGRADEGYRPKIAVSANFQETTKKKHCNSDLEREDECGICLEPCTKMVLPNCCHAMCINCYRDWNVRSESCPFCRGSLKRVESGDLWVLTCDGDVVDQETLSKDEMRRFRRYVNGLPKDVPDALFLVYYEYLI
ncbi:hypothetical protein DM860_011276 [Cuscuta australis]|uniref:RING-type domain-containing protein n=1 Tax=Cuscuta australis TaxID=267555 RepID=A0A328DSC2_9ASTE|nr:hypothetical protein DM860_011276 [Cuscuta australis]